MSESGRVEGLRRVRHLTHAIRLSVMSVMWGLLTGILSVVAGLHAGSLGVIGLGMNILADVTGSIGLIWRLRVERQDADRADHAESVASIVVAVALSVVAITLALAATFELISKTSPQQSTLAMVAAAASALVLSPLGVAKRRTGRELGSHALRGDGTMSIIGSALGVVAVLGLLVNEYWGWWWADRCAAIGISAVAVVEAMRVMRSRPRRVRRLDLR